MNRPLLLDLFCGAGGAGMGYHRAGFEVVGIDIEPQPHYPFQFHQADALEFVAWIHKACSPTCRDGYRVIHASPPCQGYTTMSNRYRGGGGPTDEHPKLIAEVRSCLVASGLPYVMENVVGAAKEMRASLLLDGGMFGLAVHRPRLFESNVLIMPPPLTGLMKNVVGVYGEAPDGRRLFTRADGSVLRAAASLDEAQEAMGMPWADWHGVKEAIPPAYTEWIGTCLLEQLEAVAS